MIPDSPPRSVRPNGSMRRVASIDPARRRPPHLPFASVPILFAITALSSCRRADREFRAPVHANDPGMRAPLAVDVPLAVVDASHSDATSMPAADAHSEPFPYLGPGQRVAAVFPRDSGVELNWFVVVDDDTLPNVIDASTQSTIVTSVVGDSADLRAVVARRFRFIVRQFRPDLIIDGRDRFGRLPFDTEPPVASRGAISVIVHHQAARARFSLSRCYGQALLRDPTLAGVAIVTFVVDGTGHVVSNDVSATTARLRPVATCLAERLAQRIAVPAAFAADAGASRVTQRFTLDFPSDLTAAERRAGRLLE